MNEGGGGANAAASYNHIAAPNGVKPLSSCVLVLDLHTNATKADQRMPIYVCVCMYARMCLHVYVYLYAVRCCAECTLHMLCGFVCL